MPTAHTILRSTSFIVAIACIVTATVIFYQIWNEVNSERPPDREFGFLFVNTRFFEVMSEHAHSFPKSNKRNSLYVWAGIGFVLAFASILF
jgi:4-amino-4-deoxy-L-arabinose transferase-like glycosyltransferase